MGPGAIKSRFEPCSVERHPENLSNFDGASLGVSSPGTRVPDWLRYLCYTLVRGLGGVDSGGPAACVGEGAVLAGAVVTDRAHS